MEAMERQVAIDDSARHERYPIESRSIDRSRDLVRRVWRMER